MGGRLLPFFAGYHYPYTAERQGKLLLNHYTMMFRFQNVAFIERDSFNGKFMEEYDLLSNDQIPIFFIKLNVYRPFNVLLPRTITCKVLVPLHF